MERVLHYSELDVWSLSIELVGDIYQLTKSFPKDEEFGLKAQIRRAAMSVPSNIAEGNGRFGNKEYIQFLSHANGSLREVETQLFIAKKLGYIDDIESPMGKCQRIGKMITKLRHSLG